MCLVFAVVVVAFVLLLLLCCCFYLPTSFYKLYTGSREGTSPLLSYLHPYAMKFLKIKMSPLLFMYPMSLSVFQHFITAILSCQQKILTFIDDLSRQYFFI